MGLIEQIITRLDNSSPQQAKIKVFALANADARRMADLLMSLFRMQPAAGQNAAQRSIQYTLVKRKADPETMEGDPGLPEEEEVATATLGTAEQNALTVTIDPRTNSLLVGGTDHYIKLVAQIIQELDSSPAHERKTEVYRVRNGKAQELALAIRSFLDQERQRVTAVLGADALGTAERMLEHEVAVVAEPTSNSLLISANPRYFEEVKMLIDQLDQAQAQVLIQVLLAEVNLTGTMDLGVEWTYHGPRGDTLYGVGTKFGVTGSGLPVPAVPPGLSGLSSAIVGNDYTFLLRALQTQGRLQVLSRPQILTTDNQQANINIGKRVPVITDTRYDQFGNTINSFRYEDVGVNLAVTPKISPDGFVKMEVGTTNSDLSSQTVDVSTVKGQAVQLPIINQRRANTTVSVQSGQTVIIGGLIATIDDVQTRKVPVLGDIPLLGVLFRTRGKITERRELLIFLTPTVLLSATNVTEPVHLMDMKTMTEQQIQRSEIRREFKPDDLQKQVLDPIFLPDNTNSPAQDKNPKPGTGLKKSGPNGSS
jgi:type II secretion system protein D